MDHVMTDSSSRAEDHVSEPLSGRIVDGPDSFGGPPPDRGPGILAALRKAWILPVGFGSVSMVLGLLVLFWPGHTIGAMTVLFGLFLVLTGGYRFIAAVQLRGVEPVARAVSLVLAALAVLVGLLCLADPFSTASVFAMVVGAFWLATGAITLFGSWQRRARAVQAGRSPGITGGVFAILVGLLILLFPGASLVVLAWILGLWLVVFGGSAVATGLTARRLLRGVASAPLYWP
jgi:uncharacterized membrane protein HdeD (DUF308 family)